ncbi:hypothetical protein GGI12_001840, partial [Dipsacomyces acuminosporus]
LNYYIVLSNYVSFAQKVLNRPVKMDYVAPGFAPNTNPGYQVGPPKDSMIEEVSVYSGNWSPKTIKRALSASDNPATDPAQSPYLTSATTGLTKAQIIGLGIGIPIGVVAIGVAVFFLYRWLKRRKENKIPNKLALSSVEDNINTLAMEEGDETYRKSVRHSLPMMFRKYYSRRTLRLEPSNDSSKILI